MAIRGKTNESLEQKRLDSRNRLSSSAKKSDSSIVGNLNRIFAKVQTQLHNIRPEKKNMFDLDSDEKKAKTIEGEENNTNQEEFKSVNNDENQNYNNYNDDNYYNAYENEEDKRLEEEARRIQEENLKNIEENTDSSKLPVGDGNGMQSAATIGIGLGIKARTMIKNAANYDLTMIGADAMSKSLTNEIKKFENQREIDKLNSFNKEINKSKDVAFEATIGTRSENQSAIIVGNDLHAERIADEMAGARNKVSSTNKKYGTVDDSQDRKTSIKKDNPYKNAASNAAKSVASVTGKAAKGVWDDISEKSESEFAEDEAKFKNKAKGFVKTEADFAKIVYARKLVGGNSLVDVDDTLGLGTKLREDASKLKNATDFKNFKDDYIALGKKEFDVDVSKLKGKEKAEFLKAHGAKGEAFLNGFEKVSKADKIMSGTGAHSAKDLAKGTAKMVGGAVIATDGEFFQGLNAKNDPFISTSIGVARTSGKVAKKGLQKLENARQEGIRAATKGEETVVKGKFQNKFYELGKEQGSGVKKTYDTSGNFFKKSVNNTRKRFHDSIDKLTRFGEKGIKTGTHVANATANGAAAGTGAAGTGTAVATGTSTAVATGTGTAAATGTGAAVAGGTAAAGAGVGGTVAAGYNTAAVADAWNPVGWVMIAVELIIMIIIMICLCCCLCSSTGVNDIFSNGSPWVVGKDGSEISDPNDSYAADTIVLLDAYLVRNFENICRRGMENQILYSQGVIATDEAGDDITGDVNYATTSVLDPFTIDFEQMYTDYNWGWDNKSDYSTSEASGSDDESLKASADAFSGDSSRAVVEYDAGKISSIKHVGPEVISSSGVDMSTASRYQISCLSGFVINTDFYEAAPIPNDANAGSLSYTEASGLYGFAGSMEDPNHEVFLSGENTGVYVNRIEHPAVIERYVYDAESRNSIFYTDYDHTIVPDLDDIIQLKNTDSSTSKTGTGDDDYALSSYSGENTPFQSATFDNTKEILSMATAAFSNVFAATETSGGARNAVTRRQFQAYCYAMWLESHYIDIANVSEPDQTWYKVFWRKITGGEQTPELLEMLQQNVSSYALGGIVPFGQMNKYDPENRKVNIIAPINKFRYSPELYHYGDYVVDIDSNGLMLVNNTADTENLYTNHVPNAVDPGALSTKTKIDALSSTMPTPYYSIYKMASAQKYILASKLTILNFNDDEGNRMYFAEYGFDIDSSTELGDKIKSAYTYNFRYFGDKTHLVKDSGGNSENTPGSFLYNEDIWIDGNDIPSIGNETLTWGYDDVYTDGQIVFERSTTPTGADMLDEIEYKTGANAFEKYITPNLQTWADQFDDANGKFKETEDVMRTLFYDRFNTNPGVDESEDNLYSVPKIKAYGDTLYDGSSSDQNLRWDNSFVTDCGVQEAYSGSILLNSLDSSNYPIKGDKNIIANILSETVMHNDANTIFKDNLPDDIDPVKYFYNSNSYMYDAKKLIGKGYDNNDIVCKSGTTTTGGIPYVVITSKYAGDFEAAKALVPDSLRCILIYVSYNGSEQTQPNYKCSGGECANSSVHTHSLTCLGGSSCSCTKECDCGLGNSGTPCDDCTDQGSHGTAYYKVQVAAHIPTAEYCGFYLCGGHTQVALMPVVLSFAGGRTLFDIKFDDENGVLLSQVCGIKEEGDTGGWFSNTTYIGQHTEDLVKIWDTTDPELASIGKQNRINAIESLADNWEDKYGLDYDELKEQSDTYVAMYDAAKLNPNPSYLRASGNNPNFSIRNKYKISSKVTFDPSAKFISSKDTKLIEALITEELDKTLDKNEEPPEGEIKNEYQNRLSRCMRAISKVGKVGYSQASHAWYDSKQPVKDGNDLFYKTDCSGYAAWVIGEYLSPGLDDDGNRLDPIWQKNLTSNAADLNGGVFNLGSTEGDLKSWTISSNFDDLKPGDLAFTDGHVVVYICTVYPENIEAYSQIDFDFDSEHPENYAPVVFIAECTAVGGKLGPGGVQFSGKGKSDFTSKYTKYILIDYDVYPNIPKEDPTVPGVH